MMAPSAVPFVNVGDWDVSAATFLRVRKLSLDRQVVVHLKSGIVCYTKWRAVYREIRQRKWDAPDFGASLKDDVTRRGVDGLS